MTPAEFLARWKQDHIDMGTQQTDVEKLAGELAEAARDQGISRDDLEAAAGCDLRTYISRAIRESVEEELW